MDFGFATYAHIDIDYYIYNMTSGSGKYHISKEERDDQVLPNKPGITDLKGIGEAEAEGFAYTELDLIEELTHETIFNISYIREIHRRALSHIYTFAGEYRSVNVSKGEFMFAAAHVIPDAMMAFEREVLLKLPHYYQSRKKLIHDIGKVHAELLFIHPFREGNGRTLRILANMMAYKQGYGGINFEPVNRDEKMKSRYITCVQAAAAEDYQPMIRLMEELLPSG